jgi:arginine transport system substrate-binding protein
MKKKILVLTPILSVLLLILFGCGKPNISEENLLIVGTNSGFPPYETVDDQGNLIGFDIAIAQQIANKLGKILVIKDMAFDALMIALQQGTIDCALAGISITKSRQQEIALIHYTGQPITELPILFWQQIPHGVHCIADIAHLQNHTICVQAGTLQAEVIEQYSGIEVKHLENIPDLIMDIKFGKSIAAVLETKVAHALQQHHPELLMLSLPLKPDQQDFGTGIGINKHNQPLIDSIQSIIHQLKDEGTIKQLEKQWFTEEIHHDIE